MNRIAKWCPLLAALILAGCSSSQSERPAGGGPNVVVIQTDDLDAASLRAMPSVRRVLGAHGTTFTNYHVTTPECCPSRASLLTGQYAHNHGVAGNERPDGGFAALDGSETLPVWLQRAGYVTAHFGRYLNGYGDPAQDSDPHEVPPGWDQWRTPITPTDHQMYDYAMNENGRLVHYGEAPRDYETDVLARDSVGFIRQRARSAHPFFLSVDTGSPHTEGSLRGPDTSLDPRPAPRDVGAFAGRALPRPPSFNEADVSDKPGFISKHPHLDPSQIDALTTLYRSRLGSLLAVDGLVRDVARELARTGQLHNTLIVFTSDNGFLLGEHRLSGKFYPYEESTRVPLVIRGPGVPAGATRDQLAANIDLAPTVLAMTGAQSGLEMDGRSLVPLFKSPGARIHGAIELEESEVQPYAAIRTKRYAYVEYDHWGPELYDLRRDPYELDNVAADPGHRAIRRRLHRRLAGLRDCAGKSCR